ncbi:corticotropin-releasing factor receptor 2-like isoform X2 [Watersipora subatra]|uniref:corticotropin-releasing factor receptor 2-like isoform X2 n=1 Tax=Watersipora subatra TaxID=2589382 RepID=UPI00355BA4B5
MLMNSMSNSTTPFPFDDCYYTPRPECLSSLYLSKQTEDKIWRAENRTFDCLYNSYLYTAEAFAYNGFSDKETVLRVMQKSCLPEVDESTCWNFTYAGFSETIPCPNLPKFFSTGSNVTRYCTNGVWDALNYKSCLSEKGIENLKLLCQSGEADNYYEVCDLISEPPSEEELLLAIIQRDIYFFGSVASLMLLTIALFIFCVFKPLQCPRVHIHKNLIVSLMLQCIAHIILFEPYVQINLGNASGVDDNSLRPTYVEVSWLCKFLFTLNNYVILTNLCWGFVEGLFLISRISIAVFSNSTPYWLFYTIGWGIPAVFSIIFDLCLHFLYKEQQCWRGSTTTVYYWLIVLPVGLVVLANTVFLIIIIRILVTKLHAVNIEDRVQIRKAMKATVVLLPLLSATGILFLTAPDLEHNPKLHYAYRITNGALVIAQGISVSVIFCFFNGEVRSAVLNYWKQWRSGSFRYRSSRASSLCVTQSEHLTPLAANQQRKASYSSHMSTGVDAGPTVV